MCICIGQCSVHNHVMRRWQFSTSISRHSRAGATAASSASASMAASLHSACERILAYTSCSEPCVAVRSPKAADCREIMPNAASTLINRQTLRAVHAPVRRAPAVKAHGCQIDGHGCWQGFVGQDSEQRGVHSPRKEDEHRRRGQSGSCSVATACGCSAAGSAGPSCCAVRAAMSCIPIAAICHAPHARRRARGRRVRTVLVHALAAQCDGISEQLQHALRCCLHFCSVIYARRAWSDHATCALVSAQARP